MPCHLAWIPGLSAKSGVFAWREAKARIELFRLSTAQHSHVV
jgi:hypothetical protein